MSKRKALELRVSDAFLKEGLFIPEGVDVTNVTYDWARGTLKILLAHDALDEVQEGCDVPFINLAVKEDFAGNVLVASELSKCDLVLGAKGHCLVPPHVATCPECDSWLTVEVTEWDAVRKNPSIGGTNVGCYNHANFPKHEVEHKYWQSDWQPVIDKVNEWAGVVEV